MHNTFHYSLIFGQERFTEGIWTHYYEMDKNLPNMLIIDDNNP